MEFTLDALQEKDAKREKGTDLIINLPFVAIAISLVFFLSYFFLENKLGSHASTLLFLAQLFAVFTVATALPAWLCVKQTRQAAKDYTQSLQRIMAFEQKNNELKMALDAHAIVAVTNSRGVITEVNEKFCIISQYSREELIGQSHRLINSSYHPPEFFKDLWRTITVGEVWSGDVCNRAKDGSLYWVHSTIVPLIGKNGKPEQYIAIRADITSRKDIEAKTKHMALHDALTGLPNRRMFTDRLARAISSKRQQPRYSAVVLLDLDHFKEVNDTLGHLAGDEFLQQATLQLSRSIGQTDMVARFGGDEFVVILECVGLNLDDAVAVTESTCEAIRVALMEPYTLEGELLEVASSMGVVLFNSEDEDPVELIKQADIALYNAKESGRNQLCFFEPVLQEEAMERALLARDLRQALANDELAVFYQPVVDEQQIIVGVEALLRWFHPVRGMVSPEIFIPLAEKNGLILPIGEWALRSACLQLAEWSKDPRRENLVIAVNVSARQLGKINFVDMVKSVLAQTGARADHLRLELTESALQNNINNTIVKMLALRHEGIRFSLDDFGTGYSSLSYLKNLPLDQLKIDKSFIDDIFDGNSSSGIVRTIMNLQEILGIGVVAEGVESCKQLEWLLNNGCKLFQGYLFSCPLDKEQLDLVLAESTMLPATVL